MKRLEKLLYQSCTFTVLISVLFFLFTQIGTGRTDLGIGFLDYFIILLFGIIIALTNMVFEIDKLKLYFKVPIHYIVLLVAFLVIFVNGGALTLDSVADYFVAIFIFTFLYLVLFVITFLVNKSVKKIDNKISSDKKKAPEKQKESYKPRFK